MTPAPASLAAIVLTRNEEKHLPDCLASLAWAPPEVREAGGGEDE